eukprot:2862484-Karenia_brevis.AAC.1
MDGGSQTDQLQRGHHSCVSDQLQCGHLSKPPASPVLFDAISQTDITVHQSLPDRFFVVNQAGQASPVIVDGDSAAGTASSVLFEPAQCGLLPQPAHASPLFDADSLEVATLQQKDFNSQYRVTPYTPTGGDLAQGQGHLSMGEETAFAPARRSCAAVDAGHASPVLFGCDLRSDVADSPDPVGEQ